MSALDRHLNRNETILLTRHGHWGALAAAMIGTAFGVGLVLLAVVITYGPGILGKPGENNEGGGAFLGYVICLFGAPMLFTGLGTILPGLSHLFAIFALTNQRVIVRTGVLSEAVAEMPLSRIESIHVGRKFFQGLLGCGSVIVKGVGATPLTFDWVRAPEEFRLQVQDQLDAIRFGSANPGGAPPVPPPLPTESWFYASQGQQYGPVTRTQVQQMLRSGHLTSQDLVWKEGMASWEPAGHVPGLV